MKNTKKLLSYFVQCFKRQQQPSKKKPNEDNFSCYNIYRLFHIFIPLLNRITLFPTANEWLFRSVTKTTIFLLRLNQWYCENLDRVLLVWFIIISVYVKRKLSICIFKMYASVIELCFVVFFFQEHMLGLIKNVFQHGLQLPFLLQY